jgi:hypothetical protein
MGKGGSCSILTISHRDLHFSWRRRGHNRCPCIATVVVHARSRACVCASRGKSPAFSHWLGIISLTPRSQLILQETFNGPPPFAATAPRRPIFYRPLVPRETDERTGLLDEDDGDETDPYSENFGSDDSSSPNHRGSNFLRLTWEMASFFLLLHTFGIR